MGGFTISDIEDRWMEEMSEKEPTEISEDFYENAANYVAELDREIEESSDLRQDILLRELKHVLELVQDIHFLRVLKVIDSVLGESGGDLLEREEESFSKVRREFESLREELVEPIFRGESELRPPREKDHKLVMFLAEVPKRITCADMRVYGPFEAGDVANLPANSADLLVKQGLGKELKVKEA